MCIYIYIYIVYMYVYIYIYIYIYIYMCICIYIRVASTASPPTKSLGFGGFDSSRLLILKGGNSHVRLISQGTSRKV